LGKLALALVLISFSLNAVLPVPAFATGTMLPNQDPTPERREYERFHERIGFPLFLGSELFGLAALVVGTAWVLRWSFRRLRSKRMEGLP
jgi:hypothetical protein